MHNELDAGLIRAALTADVAQLLGDIQVYSFVLKRREHVGKTLRKFLCTLAFD